MTTITHEQPQTFEAAAQTLAAASREGLAVRLSGAGTKRHWGRPADETDLELRTGGLDEITEHNAGDLTAVLQSGVPLAAAQRVFARAGQMLALDPPLGEDSIATIGGIMATGDAGPLRHRYGAPRDLVIGVTVALSDGAIAKAGGKVIKNVAGYDLAKLFAGSFGTLGLILSISVRLHPRHDGTTAFGACADAATLGAAAVAMAASPLEFEAFDVAWRAGQGGLLMRCAGPEHARRARRAARQMEGLELHDIDVTWEDAPLWERQRLGQRSREQAVLRVAAAPSALAAVLKATDRVQGTLVGRAALGTSYIELEPGRVAELRALLPDSAVAVLLDGPARVRGEADPWGELAPGAAALMRRVKARFDPTGTCNPGVFAAGI